MKYLLRLLTPLAMLLCSSYVFAAILASGEGEPVVLIGNYAVSRGGVFVLGLVGVVGGVALSLASLMDGVGTSRSQWECDSAEAEMRSEIYYHVV